MDKYTFTKENMEAVINEVSRRVRHEIDAGELQTQGEIHEYWNSMMQGVYSTLMVLSTNWPDVVQMLDPIEQNEFWVVVGYPED